MHKSDQITRAGLERIREYCKGRECSDCKIVAMCDYFREHTPYFPEKWTDSDITKILKATRNYMEAIFIESFEKIIKKKGGECDGISCPRCPLSSFFDIKKIYVVIITH